ncbi:MAG: right-handed parallel beta-helix repeat-containing protein [Kofleriaceae bacterium]
MVLGVVGAVVGGCSTVANPLYCDESSDCKNGFVCNLDTNGCEEQATDAGMDSGSSSCVLDDECATGVCRNDGSCELPENVLYVAVDGISAGECPADARCDITYALSKVTPARSTIRLANGSYDFASDFVVDRDKPDVTIVGGRAAIFRRAADGVLMEVRGVIGTAGPTLTLREMTINKAISCFWAGLRLQRALFDNPPSEPRPWVASSACSLVIESSELRNSTGDGIVGDYTDLRMSDSSISMSAGFGISLSGTAAERDVRVLRSTISHSMKIGIWVTNVTSFTLERSLVSYNHLGGVESTGHPFEITNNFIVRNGAQGNTLGVDSSHFGGLHVAGMGSSRLLYNTIAMNNSDPAAMWAGGVYCDSATTASNLISYNQRGNEEFPRAAIGGNCSFANSLIDQSITAVDTKFVDLIADDFHISSASPAVNAGSGMAEVSIDYDGDARTDGAPDFGADEL